MKFSFTQINSNYEFENFRDELDDTTYIHPEVEEKFEEVDCLDTKTQYDSGTNRLIVIILIVAVICSCCMCLLLS